MKTPSVSPPLLEWNFDDCPADELSACCSYEYTRSSPLICQTVKRKRAGESDPLIEVVFLLFPINVFWALSSHHWPETPYLGILAAERRSHVFAFGRRRGNLADLLIPWTHNADDVARIIAVYIPTGVPLPTLKKAFADLLQRDHPELLRPADPIKPEWRIQRRGRGSPIEQHRAALKALSTWRLREHGYTAAQALELARSHRVQLYSSEPAYRNAARKSAAKIALLEEQLRQYAAKNGTALDQQKIF